MLSKEYHIWYTNNLVMILILSSILMRLKRYSNDINLITYNIWYVISNINDTKLISYINFAKFEKVLFVIFQNQSIILVQLY